MTWDVLRATRGRSEGKVGENQKVPQKGLGVEEGRASNIREVAMKARSSLRYGGPMEITAMGRRRRHGMEHVATCVKWGGEGRMEGMIKRRKD